MYWFLCWHGYGRSRGQALIEYALIIAFVALILIGSVVPLAAQVASVFQAIKNGL